MKPFSRIGTALALSLLMPASAWALTCDDIMGMVSVNVPSNIVIQTIEASGQRFTQEDIKCLEKKDAPADIISSAQKMAAAATSTEEDTLPAKPAKEEVVEEESIGGDDVGASDEIDDSSGPAQLESLVKMYRNKKFLTASKGLWDLLEEGTFPDEDSKIKYYLAKSLFDLGMYHTAEFYFMEVVRKGPKNPYFKYALPKMVTIAEITGDDTELLRIVDKIPANEYPRQAESHLAYLQGRKLYDAEKYAEAEVSFKKVSEKSDLFINARYYEGVVNNERGKLKSAVKSFKDVYEVRVTPRDQRHAREIEELKDLALLNVARIYYGIEQYDNAEKYYSRVDRDSVYWPEALFERSWSGFMRNDVNQSLGLLLTVRSPYYANKEFVPESVLLRALSFFNLCAHGDVEKSLAEFEATYLPMRDELKAFLTQYDTEEGRKLADQAYEAYFEKDQPDSKLNKAFFTKMLRNRELADLVRHLDLLQDEEELIDSQKPAWKDTIGTQLKKKIAEDRERYKRRAGLVLLSEMSHQQKRLSELATQVKIIRFEVVDAQRQDYESKMQNPDVESADERKIDFATSREIIYWPFNGEFWKDELGYYRYTEESSCNSK